MNNSTVQSNSSTSSEPALLWSKVLAALSQSVPDDVFQMWFSPLQCLETNDEELTLGAPNDFACIWIQDNYLDLLIKTINEISSQAYRVALRVLPADSSSRPIERNTAEIVSLPRREEEAKGRVAESSTRSNRGLSTFLNPRNTFENFVIGANNELATAACIAVAQTPAQAYNPLFLYGGTGLGKTHLMHAVGHQILRTKPNAQVAYVSSEKFTNEFITAIQENTLSKFRRRYRSVDVLLIDDIHFLSGKERIQEEFFHTFNELFESQKQIVLTSDRPASEISKLESRLISRFNWGLPADIQAPDFETRLAILRRKATNLQVTLNDDVAEFIARHVAQNIRRLEGALLKVASYSKLLGGTIDLPMLEKLLRDILQEEAQQKVTIEMIQKKVVDFYDLRLSDMVSRRRPNNIAFPRQIAMYLSRTLTSSSLNDIGEAFGGRDHGTVLYACRTVENIMEQDDSVRNNIDYLKKQLGQSAKS